MVIASGTVSMTSTNTGIPATMATKTDIEIAREASKKPIQEVGARLGIPQDHLLPYGHDKAKVSAEFITSLADRENGKLVLVTAISPPRPARARRPRPSASATA